jgi:putative endonuclease
MTERNWQVYVLSCADQSLYTGVTIDVKRRLREHNESSLGARYTRARRPVSLFWCADGFSKSEAYALEASIKKMTRKQKLTWLNNNKSRCLEEK